MWPAPGAQEVCTRAPTRCHPEARLITAPCDGVARRAKPQAAGRSRKDRGIPSDLRSGDEIGTTLSLQGILRPFARLAARSSLRMTRWSDTSRRSRHTLESACPAPPHPHALDPRVGGWSSDQRRLIGWEGDPASSIEHQGGRGSVTRMVRVGGVSRGAERPKDETRKGGVIPPPCVSTDRLGS
jgi:hypothetical protein